MTNTLEDITSSIKTSLNQKADDNNVLKTVLQTLTPEQKAQVIKNLEDTFLPLGGGTVQGDIVLGDTKIGRLATNSDIAQFSGNSGSEIVLWAKGNKYEGTITLIGKNSQNNTQGQVNISPTELSFNGNFVERVSAQVNDAYYGYSRFDSGLQIVWSQSVLGGEPATVTLPIPFSSNNFTVLANYSNDSSMLGRDINIGNKTNSTFKVWSYAWGVSYIAIGWWK